MKSFLAIVMLLVPFAVTASDNECFPYCYKCDFKVIDRLGKEVLASAEFRPKTGEEELTHKILDVRGTTLKAHGTVFFTDESLASNDGYDSIRMAIAFSEAKTEPEANSAIGEVTLKEFDTARVTTSTMWHGKRIIAFMECRLAESQTSKGQD